MKEKSNINALIVDDSFLNRQLMKTILEDEFGITVTEAGDGKEALDYLHNNAPDFVILDLMMPVMDGVSALQQIRSKGLKFPIIILTADIQETTKQRCLSLGVSGFLNKPSSESDIMNLINEIIQNINK
jgi:CheY-like chemotaxis protein